MNAGVATFLAPFLTAVIGTIGGYILGNRRLKYEHLLERRAEVIAKLCELLATVQRGVVNFTQPMQRVDVDRHEQAEEAKRAFSELVLCYQSNEVWLEPDTCKKIESFMSNIYLSLGEYFDDLNERGYPQTAEGRKLGRRIWGETQPLRRELIDEFRTILYPPPWWDTPLRIFERLHTRNRKSTSESPGDNGNENPLK